MKRWPLLLIWAVVLALWGWGLGRQLKVTSDLTLFMPAAHSEVERLLVTQLREGPTSRLILIAIDGDEPEVLARVSRDFAARLRAADPGTNPFARVENGERQDDSAAHELVVRYRYLLSPTLDAQRFTAAGLHAALQERLRDLASPMEPLVQELLPSDPTGELFGILAAWRPVNAPHSYRGLWFTADRSRTLMLAETHAAGFDLDAQTVAVGQMRQAFATAATGTRAQLTLTGPGPFGVAIQDATRREVQVFSLAAGALLVLCLLAAYRSPWLVLIGGLPLATGVLAGISVVTLGFGGIHGITLAFGITLLGVAIDYPVHVFSHRQPEVTAGAGLGHLWPTLWLGVLSTCIAYLAMVFTDFTGLAQLGVFTCAGLFSAALCTRWLLPLLLPARAMTVDAGRVGRWRVRLDALPPLRWLAPALLVFAGAALWWSPHPLWENDLSALSPVPAALQDADTQLRQALGTDDVRYLALVTAPDAESALQHSAALARDLDPMVAAGKLDGYDMAARYLPSRAEQARRQAMLPPDESLRRALAAAQSGLPFRAGLFAPFLDAVAEARRLPPLTPEQLTGTLLGARVNALLVQDEGRWHALIPLQGLRDPVWLQDWFHRAGRPHARMLDLKGESERLVTNFRGEMLNRMAVAVLLIVAIMAFGLRRKSALPAVLLPAAAAALGVAALFNWLELRLTLFHLVAMMLAVGISLDYALFFNRDEPDARARARTLHSLLVCCLSTTLVFGILALSEIPVLRAIGTTVFCGVLLGFVLAALGARVSVDSEAVRTR